MLAVCPSKDTLAHAQLLGDWQVIWQDTRKTNLLHFSTNPDYPQSLSGELRGDTPPVQLAGDLEDGELTLEESPDGQKISATWAGQLVEGSCGKAFQGKWTQDDSAVPTGKAPQTRAFSLQRVVGW